MSILDTRMVILKVECGINGEGRPFMLTADITIKPSNKSRSVGTLKEIEEMVMAIMAAVEVAKMAQEHGDVQLMGQHRQTGQEVSVKVPAGKDLDAAMEQAQSEMFEKAEKELFDDEPRASRKDPKVYN